MSRFTFVADHHDAYGVKRLCTLLAVSRSGFYRWRDAGPARAERERADLALTERIAGIHRESDSTYDSPRITAELRDEGRPVNHKRVERLMRRSGIVGVHLRKKVRTTIPAPDAMPVPDLLQRDFNAAAPNQKYVGDINLPPHQRRTIPPPRNGVGLALQAAGGLVDRRPHANRTRRRRPARALGPVPHVRGARGDRDPQSDEQGCARDRPRTGA
ncbi:hypothetical protein KCMC57_up63380 [Kitasatospora sp. CMC57]|uniref:HTH-like domain-containing protein n=1 Tax=Kitasatospora sp. CMC57 TaxID=3231513 RepID=A0AB33K390_9ACTN